MYIVILIAKHVIKRLLYAPLVKIIRKFSISFIIFRLLIANTCRSMCDKGTYLYDGQCKECKEHCLDCNQHECFECDDESHL